MGDIGAGDMIYYFHVYSIYILIFFLCYLLLRRFEALLQTGKSPTCELLFDWGTTNCTVGDLVDILLQTEFFAPASLLLPGKLSVTRASTIRWKDKWQK